ncbi:unnamed protein product [Brassica rapa subsp. trilocularis]|uniref:Replication factor A C-terminal domain-containing protein n=2 Tax=Brassica TaxID=3705 RepID=M4ECZ5_BRACM|nr:unnamed protein product [Brassica napus]
MANSFTLLADLKAGHAPHRRECKHISFRLTLGGFFHSDCLKFWVSPFQQLTLMQGSVSSKYHFRFRNRLTEGSVYSLSGFDVTRRNPNFRLSDAPSPYDMIGELNAIRSTITDRIPGAQCVILTLRLQSGDNVCVSMFDSMALAFHSKLESCGKESKIVLATSVNPKIVGDKFTKSLQHHHGKKGIDAKVGKTCNDASTAKRAPSSKEQVAEKSRVE